MNRTKDLVIKRLLERLQEKDEEIKKLRSRIFILENGGASEKMY